MDDATPEPLTGAPKLIAALTAVHNLENDLFGWAHLEEHWFEHLELDKLACKFHKAVASARDRRRPILDRIYQLGGKLEGLEDDPISALTEWLSRLSTIHGACQAAYDACEFSNGKEDYVTQVMLTENQEAIEDCMSKVAAKLRYLKAIGPELTLTELE